LNQKIEEMERNGRSVSKEWMERAFLNNLWLEKYTAAKEMREDRVKVGESNKRFSPYRGSVRRLSTVPTVQIFNIFVSS
jgi:hypothetical protein